MNATSQLPKLIFSITFIFFLINSSTAQDTFNWDGGAGTTNWSDANNWNPDSEPGTGDIASFGTGTAITVTGTPTNDPGQIIVTGGTTLTLDLDLDIVDNGTNSVQVNANSSLTFGVDGNNRTFNITSGTSSQSLRVAAASSFLEVAPTTTVNVLQADIGINLQNAGATFTNNGTITISGADNEGIQIGDGDLNNNGSIDVSSTLARSIQVNGGTFDNNSTGTIDLSNSTAQAIDLTLGTFTNDGTIEIPGASNEGIEIDGGTFNNNTTINVSSAAIRAFQINGGTFNNSGTATITISNTTDQGIDATGGTFTNDGILTINSSSTDGIQLGGGTFNTSSTATTTISAADFGIDMNSGTFNNDGALNITSTGQFGVRITDGTFNNTTNGSITTSTIDAGGTGACIVLNASGTTAKSFTNDGAITVTSTSAEFGIEYLSGSFTNNASGTITITSVNTDGIRITSTSFTNAGTINTTVKDAGTTNEYGIDVQASATLTNSGTINADGGAGSGRSIGVFGTLNNTGTLNISNGDLANALRIPGGGNLLNDANGLIDLTLTRIAVNASGTFTNNGFIKSTYVGGVGVNTGGTSTNNGFYSHSDGSVNTFSSGGGTISDNGIDVDDAANTTFDAASSDQVADIGIDVAYSWYDDAANSNQIASNDASGLFTFTSSPGGTVSAFTVFGADVELTITNVATILPVELLSFEVAKANASVQLSWMTSSELNNLGFEVQRSYDGTDWHQLDFVEGNGTTNHFISYEFYDHNPLNGANYYRLKQMDFDGQFELLPTRRINWQSIMESVSVYPNPSVDGVFTLSNIDLSTQDFYITNMQGKKVGFDLLNSNQLSIGTHPSGIYFLQWQHTGETGAVKLLKVE